MHNRDDEINDIFKEIKDDYTTNICKALRNKPVTGLGFFLSNYTKQIETLLHIIRSCRQSNFIEFLAALDEQCKYFFAHDLYNYARMIPAHLAMMEEVKQDDPQIWDALVNETFGVNKSQIPFTTLFVDQNLEQKIKDIKGVGGVDGITQNEDTLNRFFLTAPYITQIVNEFIGEYSGRQDHDRAEHYQLTSDVACRISKHASSLKKSIEIHCEGNPYTNLVPLKNIVSSMVIPDNILSDILDRDDKGQASYMEYVTNRLLDSSEVSIWDTMKKIKLKTCSTWMAKTVVKVGEKIIKLREERQLLAQFLIIHQARPQLLLNLPETIGQYEMAVKPRSLFVSDGSLLVPKDKSSFMHAIEDATFSEVDGEGVTNDDQQMPDDQAVLDEVLVAKDIDLNASGLSNIDLDEQDSKVIIFDGMAILQSVKKNQAMKKIFNLGEQFIIRVKRLMKGYSEGRVLFDQYIENSLK